MGTLLSRGKSEYYFRLLSYLQDSHIYDNDARVVAYTPNLLQDYVDFFPDYYEVYPAPVLSVFINGTLAGVGNLNVPSGLFYVKVNVPKGNFTLQVKTATGQILTTKRFVAKNYAMFFDAAAQGYEERRVQIEQVLQDLSYATLRSDRVYPVVGVFFNFLPPPGWSNQQYRDTILGNGTTKPGFIESFFYGGTIKGFVDTIRSITGGTVTLAPVEAGERWVVYDAADAPNPTVPNDASWFVSNAPITAPDHQALVLSEQYKMTALDAFISDASVVITGENVFKASNSFLQTSLVQPFVLAGLTLTFSIGATSYSTTFSNTTTTAAQAATDILTQNPSLTNAVYAYNGYLRIGAQPGLTQTAGPLTITALSGTALSVLGLTAGQGSTITWDQLANPNQTTPVVLTSGPFTFVQGTDFTVDTTTGYIYWAASSATEPNIPPQGTVFQASYTYIMKREIETMAELAKDPSITVNYNYI